MTKNRCQGVVCHSMVGSLAAALGELDNPARRASWHYSVTKGGIVYCHYQDEAVTWHAGAPQENARLIGIEHEGGLNPYNEPLTREQLMASIALVRWLAEAHGFPLVRGVGLMEHNEVSAEPTACPSNRIPWHLYTEEEPMTPEEKARLENVERQVFTARRDLNELANGMDAVSVANKWPISLKGLWYIAKKAWPY